MPVTRSDPEQTSIELKMRVYLAAHAAKQHQGQFAWKNFRVLLVTTDRHRTGSMIDALDRVHIPRSVPPSLFLFATFADLGVADPLEHEWLHGSRRKVDLV